MGINVAFGPVVKMDRSWENFFSKRLCANRFVIQGDFLYVGKSLMLFCQKRMKVDAKFLE